MAIIRGCWAGAFMLVLSLLIPDQFKSEATVLPDRSRSRAAGSLGDLSKAAGLSSILGNGAEGEEANFPEILVSRWVCERLLAKEYAFHLRSWRFGAWQARKETLFNYLDEADQDRALQALQRIYNAEKVQRSNIISLSITTKSPELSQQVMEEALQLLDQFLNHEVQSKGKIKARFAQQRVQVAKDEFLSAERDLKAFAGRNQNYPLSPDPGVRLEGQRLEGYLKIRGDVLALTLMNQEHALMESVDDTAAPNVLDHPNLPIRKSRPMRLLLVLLVTLLAACVSLIWDERKWISSYFRSHEA
jgi:capsule polysaccharide export protein KpsE/RkpR